MFLRTALNLDGYGSPRRHPERARQSPTARRRRSQPVAAIRIQSEWPAGDRPARSSNGGNRCLDDFAGSALVDLLADDGDRALVDGGGIPGLDGAEIRLARLVSAAGAPAMALEEIRRRHQRRARIVEAAAGAVVQNALRQELRVADLAVHRAARARRQDAAIDQRQRRVELVGEIGAAPAVIGEG